MSARQAIGEAPVGAERRRDARHGAANVASRAAAWAILPLYVTGVLAYLVLAARLAAVGRHPAQDPAISAGFACFAAVGAVLVAKRPRNAIGWVMGGAALLVGIVPAGDAYAALVMTTRGRPDSLAVAGAWSQSWYWFLLLALVFVALPLLFPDGRLPSRRFLVPAVLSACATAAAVVLGMLTGTLTGQDVPYRIVNPVGIRGLPPVEELPVFGLIAALFGVGVVSGVDAVVVRFRRSRGVERQQMKWFLYAVWPLLLTPAIGLLPGIAASVVFGWLLVTLPVAVAIAVLRYRLDGIDVVINRTLVYAALSALLVGIYVLIVGWLGALFASPEDRSVSLIATGIVAVLFAPARERVQRGVDHLLYGQRSEPYAALTRLGRQLEATLATDAVLPAIVATVREALRLPYAAIALADTDGTGANRLVAHAGDPVPDVVRLPLLYQAHEVGTLVLGLRSGESDFSSADRRLLSDLARQAGVAVSAVRLTADLQRSRELLVGTREEERRRLRRDLHDGLGGQLAALAIQAGVLRGLIVQAPAAAESLAADLRQELRAAIADIRRLVHGLRPPALDELGLVGAVQRLAERSSGGSLHVTVETPEELPALPAAVEVAAHRIVAEALTNVDRHSAAKNCTIRLATGPHEVCVTVTDDGVGLPVSPTRPGVGMTSMRERAAEMGGACTVDNAPGGGTRVRARFPLSP